MLRYALHTIAARKAGFVGACLALFCAAALVTACGTLLETGLRGEIATERYAGTPIVVSGDQDVHHEEQKGDKTKHKAKPVYERAWLPADTVQRIEAVPGVDAAVPELTFPAVLIADDGTPVPGAADESLGHAWTSAVLTPFHVERGHAPRADDEIVLDRGLADRAGLAPGDAVTVQATGAPATYRVVGVTAEAPAQQSAVFFTDAEARRLAGHAGQVAAIGVFPESGTDSGGDPAALADAIEAALAGTSTPAAEAHTGAGRGPAEFLDASKARVELISMGGAMGGTSLLVAVLVVVGTFALTIQQRHRELALLRAIAATPRQIRGLIGREALAVALVAGLLGAAAGQPLARLLYEQFVDLGVIPETLSMVRSAFPPLAAVLSTLLVAQLAARLSARRVARLRPAESLTEATVERRPGLGRLLAGLVVLAGGVVLLFVLSVLRTEPAAMPVTYLTVLMLSVAVALLGPFVARAAFALLPRGLTTPAGHLAAHNTRANARRLASVITPLTLLTAMTGTVLFTQTTLAEAADQQVRDGIVADAVLAAAPGASGVPGPAADRLRDLDGVTAVTEVVHTTVRSPGLDQYTVQGVTLDGLDATMRLAVTDGTLADLAALGEDGVAISDLVSATKGLRPGDEMPLVLGDGTPVTLTVAAVYERGLGFGDLTMAHALVAAHIDNPLSDSVLVAGGPVSGGSGDPGGSAEFMTRLADALAADYPAVAVAPASHLVEAQAEERRSSAEVAYIAMGLVLAFTTIAAVNTLAMSTADRAGEFALLRLVGATRRQVLAMLRFEALAVAATALALGTAICLATLSSFSAGMAGGAGVSIAPAPAATIAAGAIILSLVATALPARLALRTQRRHGSV